MGYDFAEFFEPMCVHALLLRVVAHALEVALLFDFLDDLVHVCLDIAFHVLDLLEGLRYLGSLDIADLTVPMRLLFQELEVLIPDVGDVVQHFFIEVSNILSLLLVTILHVFNGVVLVAIILLQLPQRMQEIGQFLSFFVLHGASILC